MNSNQSKHRTQTSNWFEVSMFTKWKKQLNAWIKVYNRNVYRNKSRRLTSIKAYSNYSFVPSINNGGSYMEVTWRLFPAIKFPMNIETMTNVFHMVYGSYWKLFLAINFPMKHGNSDKWFSYATLRLLTLLYNDKCFPHVILCQNTHSIVTKLTCHGCHVIYLKCNIFMGKQMHWLYFLLIFWIFFNWVVLWWCYDARSMKRYNHAQYKWKHTNITNTNIN